MPASSAGILMYRRTGKTMEVLLVHPGGPFWRNKDRGAWSIPKEEIEPGEEPADVAQREFREELGSTAGQPLRTLGEIRQRGGKRVIAFAVEGNLDCVRSRATRSKWNGRRKAGGGRARSCGMVRSDARKREDSRQPATPSRSDPRSSGRPRNYTRLNSSVYPTSAAAGIPPAAAEPAAIEADRRIRRRV